MMKHYNLYLDDSAAHLSAGIRPRTPSSYLSAVLTGRALQHLTDHTHRLVRALAADEDVVAVLSVRGAVAYARRSDMSGHFAAHFDWITEDSDAD